MRFVDDAANESYEVFHLVTRLISALALTVNLAVYNVVGYHLIEDPKPEQTLDPVRTVQSSIVREDTLIHLDNSSLDFESTFSREGQEIQSAFGTSEQDSRVAQATSASDESPSLIEVKPDYEWVDFEISYYTKDEPGMNGLGITSTGTQVEAGRTIAVDPKVIPYGTRIYIEGLGYRVAEDCGSAIKGNRIDVYVDSVDDFPAVGRHTAKIRIVK